ncbi:hypothetical protein [Rhodococcus sp. JT-3]|uniref:hypothetical protein n=1 Tax=Rhodococcus sp. JT-3 TaxID=1973213 RepID=UPI001303C69C|nr:hypothetical protein [Rhodococcus sp. JT-3]MYV31215.1 hypothetical protein [Rhodococcus erythropolis]
MPLPVIEFSYLGTVYSPFSGQEAETESGPNEGDPTLLFTYYGAVADWAYISPLVVERLSEDPNDLEPKDLAERLDIKGGLIMVVDTDWNGINYYGFAPNR